ncbi:hypothetical protein DFH09DRAFT_1159825 [Mycena vulgaris]|nr:hypothetical protein DFH09DRAFT_1159825 [Mycena vulgaris]
MPPATQMPCAVCRTLSSTRCSQCSTAYYCSSAHQKAHWKVHKSMCLAPAVPLPDIVKTRAEAERDGDNKFVVDAILLPFDSEIPRFVKLVCTVHTEPNDDDDFAVRHQPELGPYLSLGSYTFFQSMDISTMGFGGPPLGYTLCIRCRDTFLVDGSKTNQSIVKLTKGKTSQEWRGNLIAYRVDEPRETVVKCKDAKAEDLAALAAYFVGYGKRSKKLGR